MNLFKALGIKRKITMGNLVMLLLIIALGVFSLSQLAAVNRQGEEFSSNHLPTIVLLKAADDAVGTARRSELQSLIVANADDLAKYEKRFNDNQKQLKEMLESYGKLRMDDGEKKQIAAFQEKAAHYFTDSATTFELVKQGKVAEGKQNLWNVSKKSYDDAMKAIEALTEYNVKEGKEAGADIAKVYSKAQYGVAAVLIACFVIGIILSNLMAASICGPIRRLADDADKVAKGDLSVAITTDSRDEVGQLATAFAAMVENLRSVIGKVTDTSTQVSSAANQLFSTSEQMATGAEEVASQASTVATASEEMAATSGDIAQTCHRAADASHHATSAAQTGAQVVEKTVTVMGRIAERVRATATTVESLGTRSDQIGAIVGTIEDIADQTNLLALNAAIEAARAGEQGRGFAVVADEVRALAERTTRATKEISAMIKAIQSETRGAVAAMEEGVHEVESGTGEAGRSGEALTEILDQINAVGMQVSQIATAAEQQTATTSEISSNIQQITEVVQVTARGAQESATAASQLARQAEELQRLVAHFKVA
ncbi:methyl-accepting chemotaxis protein [Geobacter sp.]|uniref:methyl-accepting chemotaxis protein n=1 Tax=Geobacter sp. TaxID=46610 RepID=UPI0027B8D445|nr:methyl-accepting chemotaxis protein [Geobacter sp.]